MLNYVARGNKMNDGFNGYYADEEMSKEVYVWIKTLEQG
jgi:hypothetical protein